MLLLKDTENHPDVIAQRKLIDALRKSGSGAPSVAKTGDAGEKRLPNGKRSLPNPIYDQLKVKLIDAETQVTSLQRQRDDAIRTRDKLEKI